MKYKPFLKVKLDAEKIINILKEKCMNLSDLARKMNVSRQYVYQILYQSRTKHVRFETAQKIANALEVELKTIITE